MYGRTIWIRRRSVRSWLMCLWASWSSLACCSLCIVLLRAIMWVYTSWERRGSQRGWKLMFGSLSMLSCRASRPLLDSSFWLVSLPPLIMGMRTTSNVFTASLRIQTNVENKAEFSEVSPERYEILLPAVSPMLTIISRAFADYVFGSLILHFFCVNFINWMYHTQLKLESH